jgi:ribulose-5-phosphate 4-epimerase/fuculose-1-phosphate aldolase
VHTALKATVDAPAQCLIQVAGEPRTPLQHWLLEGLDREFRANGHLYAEEGQDPTLVINLTDARRPRPFRRRSQGTFVIGIIEVGERPEDILKAAYPLLVRSLSNLLIYVVRAADGTAQTHFVTLEQGYYTINPQRSEAGEYFREVYRRLAPLATTRLVINNVFEPDLPEELWTGDERTTALMDAGRRLDGMNLLPAAFPIAEILGERDFQHVKRLFGLGGLSYGNLSVRADETRFWMSARGVNKGRLEEIGRDVLLITDYLPEQNAMVVSVPANVEPRAASVDAIEHWMIYRSHPEVGAIIHVHAWMDGIASTSVNYPCGTYELACEVAELVAAEPDPGRAVIGLKNHGLTITGRSLEEIFERIDGRLIPTIPME